MEADKRLVLTKKILDTAVDTYGLRVEDIVIDPLAMPIGADPTIVNVATRRSAGSASEFGVNMTLGASNVSFGMPGRHAINATFLPMAMTAGLTSAIMDARTPQIVESVKAADLLLGHDEWGGSWIAAHRAKQAAETARSRRKPPRGPSADDRGLPHTARRRRAERRRADRPGGAAARGADRPPVRPAAGTPAEHDGTGRVRLHFTPSDREVRVPPGVTVFDAASWNGIAIDSTCGGHGTCKKCKVQIVGGSVPVQRLDARSFTGEQLNAGWRLACLAQATGDLTVDVPPLMTRPKAATVGVGRQVILRPAIQKRYVELSEPTLSDQQPDLARLLAAIDDLELRVDIHALRRLPTVARASDFKLTAVVVDDVLIDVEPGDTTERRYAVAFDLGTTTVVATLLDTSTGTPAAVASMLNKQQPFGADVITRISATMMDPAAQNRLRDLAHETLDELTRDVCAEAGIDPAEIYEIAVAGNATMSALALGIDPEPLGVAPVHHVERDAPRAARHRPRCPRPPPRSGRRDAGARRLRRRRHRGRDARVRDGPRQAHPALHRRRHELRDRAQQR